MEEMETEVVQMEGFHCGSVFPTEGMLLRRDEWHIADGLGYTL